MRECAEARFALDTWASSVRTTQPVALATIDSLRRELHSAISRNLEAIRIVVDHIGVARGRWLQTTTGRRFLWERANPLVQSRPFDLPTRAGAAGVDDLRRVDVSAWQGEYESAAISLFNCGDAPLIIKPTLTPLRGPEGEMRPASDAVTMRHVVYVAARGEGRIGDALVRIPEVGFRVEPGRAGQLWLTIHAPELAPGTYHFAIDLTISERGESPATTHEMLQGSLTVHPLRFPATCKLKSYAWAYLERSDLTKDVAKEALADLRAHYINTDVLYWSSCMPMPRPKEDGGVNMRLYELVTAFERYGNSDSYLFYWGLGNRRRNVPNMPDIGSPAWRKGMDDWLTKWVGFMKEQGIGYDRILMYPFDEMLPEEFVTLARFIKEEVDPHIRIFANSRGDKAGNELSRMAPYVDVWCWRDVPYGARIAATEQRVRREASEVWTYDCARPAKGKPPLGYYRLQPWRAFDRGETGCGFWTYTDPGEGNGDAWDDFSSPDGRYGVIYGPIGKPPRVDLSGERIVPSRRWEAWREGVEDYEYLSQLRQAIESAEKAGRSTQAEKAQSVLDRAVREVLEHPLDADVVYEARRTVTQAMLELANATPKPE